MLFRSQTLLLLKVPVSKVVRTLADIRSHRYSVLRSIFRREGARVIDEDHALREELHTVVLPPGAWERWLDPDLHDADELLHLLAPTPASLVAFHAVSTDVNRVANRGPHLLDELPGVTLDAPPA